MEPNAEFEIDVYKNSRQKKKIITKARQTKTMKKELGSLFKGI